MKKYDAVIIGGGPAGVQAALSARHAYPNKTIGLIRREKISMIPCGIPYIVGTLKSVDENILPDQPLLNNGIEIIIGDVESRDGKTLTLAGGESIEFDKVVLASGSSPILPGIPGVDKEGVHILGKQYETLIKFREAAQQAKKVLIIGGGFIGVELAYEFLKIGKSVTIVDLLPHVLATTMDEEFCEKVESVLRDNGCEIITGVKIDSLTGDKKVTGANLNDEKHIDADFVLVSVGYHPNVKLAEVFNLEKDAQHGIIVDEYMRTSDQDVFAAGDCAITKSCFTGKNTTIMLASAAMAQGRLAGSNLFGIKIVKTFSGTLGTFATKIDHLVIGSTGLTENQAKAQGINYVVGTSEAPDKHPGKLPGMSIISMKLIFSQLCHTLLGAQVSGGDSVGEMINMLSVMIQKKMTDMEIDTMQIGTHPLLTSSPIVYPVLGATVNSILKWYHDDK